MLLPVLAMAVASSAVLGQQAAPGSLLPGGAKAWKLVWNDEFDAPNDPLDLRWKSQNSGSTHILSSRWRENAVASNGTLKLINNRISYHNGSKWVGMASFDVKAGNFNFARDFQTYGLEWSEKELVFYFNGKVLRREKNTFCHSPSPVWLSLAIIPWAGNITDAIHGTRMEVDYVRIYQRK